MRELAINLARIAARWVMWSKKHLLVGGVVVIVLLAGVAVAVSGGGHSHPPRTSGAGSSAPALPTVAPNGSVTAAPTVAPRSPVVTVNGQKSVNPEIIGVARAFVTAWAHTTDALPAAPTGTDPAPVGKAAWLSGLRSCTCVTPRLYLELTSTDPFNVPVSKVSGNPQYTASADGQVLITVPTPEYTVLVTVIQFQGRWRADGVDVGA